MKYFYNLCLAHPMYAWVIRKLKFVRPVITTYGHCNMFTSAATGCCQDTCSAHNAHHSSRLDYCNSSSLVYGSPNSTCYRECRTVLHMSYCNSGSSVTLNLCRNHCTSFQFLTVLISNWQLWHIQTTYKTFKPPSTNFQSAFWFVNVTMLIHLSFTTGSMYSLLTQDTSVYCCVRYQLVG